MKAKLKAFFKKIYKEKYYYFFRLPGYFYVTIDMLYCQLESFLRKVLISLLPLLQLRNMM